MATSLQLTSDHQYPINLSISQEDHHQTKASAETMNQQITGRSRRSKGGANKSLTQKKKQSQRGMGVEKLERLRLQELISSKTSPLDQFPKLYGAVNQVMAPDFLLHQRVANCTVPYGSSTYGSAPVTFGDQLVISGHDQFQTQMGLNGFATNSKPSQCIHAVNPTEKSKELSSLKNLMSIKSSCFSDRCSSCNKKKRMINGDDMGRSNTEAGIVHMENVIGENQYFGTKPLLHPFSIPSHLEKGVEIVAIHRKGNSSSPFSEEGLVMEYEFFPTEKSGRSNTTSYFENDMMMKKMMATSSESSSVAAAAAVGNGEASCVTTISWVDTTTTTTTPTSSIDLSLKLSF
ncbi:PREDICTED: uncharacterized protein LOC109242720 [Nicotiana attenuata]|uniref:Uncharacterized protein n=1 Tax=Nicotiana attenuata TaxID=49451 RepID=A0A314L4N2_NICAT|nr:PREDICTED: uncharacterized protein LOC109242720 [Nicotiana attenuata]OIT35934.1 hypothetical protein A4A49_16346 [Nicotiana attenuata]